MTLTLMCSDSGLTSDLGVSDIVDKFNSTYQKSGIEMLKLDIMPWQLRGCGEDKKKQKSRELNGGDFFFF